MAGKFEKFAQRFPLQRFGEKFKEVTLKKFLIAKNFQRQQLTENPVKNTAPPRTEKAILVFQVCFFSSQSNFFAKQSSKFHFATNFAMGFVRGDARVSQDMKKMKWQMDQTGDNKI